MRPFGSKTEKPKMSKTVFKQRLTKAGVPTLVILGTATIAYISMKLVAQAEINKMRNAQQKPPRG